MTEQVYGGSVMAKYCGNPPLDQWHLLTYATGNYIINLQIRMSEEDKSDQM